LETTTNKDTLNLAIQCLACYNMGKLTFYWKSYTKNTTLEEIENSLDVETIHTKAKTPYLCNCDEYSLSDYENIKVEEYATAKDIYKLVELLQDVDDTDYINAYCQINHVEYLDRESSSWTEFKDNVLVFNWLSDALDYTEEYLMDVYDYASIDGNYFADWINWDSLKEYALDNYFWCVEISLGYKDEETHNKSRFFVWSRD
jgi:hypothetical protein